MSYPVTRPFAEFTLSVCEGLSAVLPAYPPC
jgi:hypothetical protein